MRPVSFAVLSAALVGVLAPVLAPSLAAAQNPCRVPTESNEAKLLYYYAVPLSFSMPVRPLQLRTGGISVGGDLT